MKTVAAPSIGRIVLYKSSLRGLVQPGVICELDTRIADLIVVAVIKGERLDRGYARYGENKAGCWWWPPRTDETMEVPE